MTFRPFQDLVKLALLRGGRIQERTEFGVVFKGLSVLGVEGVFDLVLKFQLLAFDLPEEFHTFFKHIKQCGRFAILPKHKIKGDIPLADVTIGGTGGYGGYIQFGLRVHVLD